jgi:hypothetical protein
MSIKDVEVTLFAQPVWVYGQSYVEEWVPINATTKDDGGFTFENVPSNYYDYYFECSYTESPNNNHLGIEGNDAQLISQIVVAEEIFDGAFNNFDSIAADVNQDGLINSYDSSLIIRYLDALSLSESTSFSMNEVEMIRWKFVSEPIPSLIGNIEDITIYGIKLGDPDGSWEPEAR